MLPDSVYHIYGHISPAEMDLLYRLASQVSAERAIVEIGSFQGKSTVCLGLGAKQSGARVFAIDPHENEQVNAATHYGMENHAALLKNLVDFEVADVVRVVALPSLQVADNWYHTLDLVWIDGCHEFQAIFADLIQWSNYISPNGRIAVHDSSGHFPPVTQALQMFLMDHEWKIAEQIDATTVLVRSNV